MEQVIQFLQIYWKDILYLIISLVVVIITLIKRKNVVNVDDCIKSYILDSLPSLISFAEGKGLKGAEKKQIVMELMIKYVEKHFGNVVTQPLFEFIDDAVERILICPQRKGVIYEEKSKQVRR